MAGILKTKGLREYSQAALNSAIVCHQSGGMSLRKAAKVNGIPYPTFRRYLLEPEKRQVGKPTKFSGSEEQAIGQILLTFADTKLSLSEAHLEQVVCKFSAEKGIVCQPLISQICVFCDRVIIITRKIIRRSLAGLDRLTSNKWLRGFLKRNPTMAKRLATSLDRKKSLEWNTDNCEFPEYSDPLDLIANILRNSMKLDGEKTEVCLEAIMNIDSEHLYLAKTIRAAAQKSIIAPKPK